MSRVTLITTLFDIDLLTWETLYHDISLHGGHQCLLACVRRLYLPDNVLQSVLGSSGHQYHIIIVSFTITLQTNGRCMYTVYKMVE